MTKQKYLIVGDIAGQFDALIRLVAMVPVDTQIILVGDLIDRGPKSFEVIEWCMKNPDVIVLKGNHEHLCEDFHRGSQVYADDCWRKNGGDATESSYPYAQVSLAHLKWISALPLYFMNDEILVSHAPIPPCVEDTEEGIASWFKNNPINSLWNREEPVKRSRVQFFGHNSHWGIRPFWDITIDVWAICLDSSRRRELTGIFIDGPGAAMLKQPYDLPFDYKAEPEVPL